jgi:carboxypeptidase Taq
LTELVSELRSLGLLKSCQSLLAWDEQTYMPPQGAELRADQLALLAGMAHQKATQPRIGELLSQLTDTAALGGPNSEPAALVREARREYDRATKLPQKLVEELTRTATLSQQAWIAARKAKSFPQFLPWLEKMIHLKQQEADAVGYTEHRYDALVDEYEPGATTAQLTAALTPLRNELVPLVAAIADSRVKPDASILTRHYPIEAQREFGRKAAQAIGFSFESGRLDEAAHPFCQGIGPGDCRLTTRYDEQHFPGAFFGTLHEAGHGMYEQGLPAEQFGTPLGATISLGIHESQSRMWENLVGRSRSFWQHFYPTAQKSFPEALSGVSLDEFYKAVNEVRSSWIRVEADEVTYNLHILLRFEMEQALIAGDIKPSDVPGAWNEKFQSYFGMTPPNDALGCIQDIHWSAGLIGYFATYTLGNMYGSQFFAQARNDLGDLDAMFAKGEFAPLLEWLRKNIHSRGQHLRAGELVQTVTGNPLSHQPLMAHLKAKFGAIYGL